MALTELTPRDGPLVQWADSVGDDMLAALSPTAGGPGAALALVGSLLSLLLGVKDLFEGRWPRAVMRFIGIALLVAVSQGAGEVFRAADAVIDLPTVATKYAADNRGEKFYESGTAFPLRQKYRADFSFRVTDATLRQKIETATRHCVTPDVLEAVRTKADPKPELQKARVLESGSSPSDCKTYVEGIDQKLPPSGAPSNFASRRAVAHTAWGVLHPGEPLPEPGAERDEGARAREKGWLADPLSRFGKWFGIASAAIVIVNRLLFVFLMFPEMWKFFVGYVAGAFWVRLWPIGLWAAHHASLKAVTILQGLGTDTDTTFLHSVGVYDPDAAAPGASADASYVAFYADEMSTDWVSILMVSVVLGAILAIATLWMVRRGSRD